MSNESQILTSLNSGIQTIIPKASFASSSPNIIDSGVASGLVVGTEDYVIIKNNGTVKNTIVNGGALYVSSGGQANDTTVNAGWIYVSSGATVDNTNFIGALDPGTNTFTCYLFVKGGTANNTTLSTSYIAVSSGGSIKNTTLTNGCNLYLSPNCYADGLKLVDSNYVNINSGCSVNDLQLNSGSVYLASGASITNAIVNSDGCLYINGGASATNIQLASNAILTCGIDKDWTTVVKGTNANGQEFFVSNGKIQNLSGNLIISSGGLLTGIDTSSINNIQILDGGIASNVRIADMDFCHLTNSGTCNDVTLENTTLYFYGKNEICHLNIEKDGTADFTKDGASASDVNVKGILRLQTLDSGTVSAENITIHAGGLCQVGIAGIARDVLIESGGSLALNYCSYEEQGTATNVIVQHGGRATADFEQSYFLGTLEIAGKVSVKYANTLSNTDSIDFKLGMASSDEYLSISSGNLSSEATITVDVSNAYGDYQLIRGGVENLTTITVINEGYRESLTVGKSIELPGGKAVELTKRDSSLALSIHLQDDEAPETPGNITGTLTQNTLAITCDAVSDKTGVLYEIEYSKDNTFQSGANSISSTSPDMSIHLGSGTWYWRLRAVDGAGNASDWSNTYSQLVAYTDILEGHHIQTKTYYGDLVIREDANVNAKYPAAVQILNDVTVTVEGGTLKCDSIRNAAILFGEDAYWVGGDYGPHYNGTVNFTGTFATLESQVSDCITAAGIVGKNLAVSFQDAADRSAGIILLAGQGAGPGNYAQGITADESLTINGSFAGTVISLFDYSLIAGDRGCYAYGFEADNSITINGDISGTIIASAYSKKSSYYGFGLYTDYTGSITVNGVISGTIAAFGQSNSAAIYGGDVNVTVNGTLFAGTPTPGDSEQDLLELFNDPESNASMLASRASSYDAIFGYGRNSNVTYLDGAMIYGKTKVPYGSLTVSTGAFLSDQANANDLTIKVERNSGKTVFGNGWSISNSITIDVADAVNGTYILAEDLSQQKNITVVCGSESALWKYNTPKTITFSNGRSISIDYSSSTLTLTAQGFSDFTDTQAPDISALDASPTAHDNAVLLSWKDATDNVAVAGYRIRYASIYTPQDFTTVRVADPQCYIRNLENGTYIYQIQAFDNAGNDSDWSESNLFTVNLSDGSISVEGCVPLAEYMYGCTPTATGMLLGYYDLFGYNGFDFSNLIDGDVDLLSRGTDGNVYDMDAFDTVLGNAIATEQYVSRFIDKSEEEERPYTFIGDTQQLNTQYYDCIAAWLGTGMAARGNIDLSTLVYIGTLKELELLPQAKIQSFLCGLNLYVESKGYKLDKQLTRTANVDGNKGDFTFQDYMAEIDAGRPVLVHISGHTMVGYGYDKEHQEIIFDDCYEHDQRMAWNGTYNYSSANCKLEYITTIVFDCADSKLPKPTCTPDTTELTNQSVTVTVAFKSGITARFYSYDGINWTEFNGDTITVDNNATLYVKGENSEHIATEITVLNISNIDKTAPDQPTASASTTKPTNQPVTVTATFSEDSVQKQYSLDNETWNDYTVGIVLKENKTVYFRGIDEATNVSAVTSFTVANIDTTAPDMPEVSASTTDPTNQPVTVTAIFSEDTAQKQYSQDNLNWFDYTDAIVINDNATLYFRGIDAANNVSAVAVFTVANIDKTAPNKPEASASTTAPTNQPVTVSATFSEDSSQKQYSFDNETWNDYTDGIEFTENGTVYFRGIDAATNVSDITAYTVTNIDTIAPDQPTATASTTALTNQPVTVTATFSEDSVQKQYSLDNNSWKDYTDGIVLNENGTVYFRGIDEATNVSDVTVFTVANIDTTIPDMPEVSASTTAPTNQPVTVTAIFSENTVQKQFSQDSQHWLDYTGAIVLNDNATLYFRGIDAANNVSAVAVFTVANIDKTAPDKPVASASTTAPTNQPVTVSATFTDDSLQKQYSFDNETWNDYTDGIEFTENGTIYFRGIDAATNISDITAYTVTNIDTIAPDQPTAYASTTVPTNQPVTVTATFSEDSVKKQYSFDNETWNDYTDGIVLNENGTVYFRGIDEATNVSDVTSFTVKNIDTTAPQITNVSISEPNAFAIADIAVEYDNDVKEAYYSLDGDNWKTLLDKQISLKKNATVRFKLIDEAGNETISEEYEAPAFNVKLDALEIKSIPDSDGKTLSWDNGDHKWVSNYQITIEIDKKQLKLPQTIDKQIEVHTLIGDSISWEVKPDKSDVYTKGETILITPTPDPTFIKCLTNDMTDIVIAKKEDTWKENYRSRHVGSIGDWSGTRETVSLKNQNKIADVFAGSNDTTLLYLSDDANGDALFVEDIYTTLPGSLTEQQSRIAQIDCIFAGAGNDIIDLTSQKFEYIGSGVTVHGGTGNDTIWANKGNNILFGDAGNDRIVGASGNDIIVGGAGNDSMHGGGGDDIFCFGGNWGQDTVEQLSTGKVTIWFAEGDESNWNPETMTYQEGQNSVTVTGVSEENITLRFGDKDTKEQFDELLAAGAFSEYSSDQIFKNSSLATTIS